LNFSINFPAAFGLVGFSFNYFLIPGEGNVNITATLSENPREDVVSAVSETVYVSIIRFKIVAFRKLAQIMW
jgi:hypothetical protein